MYALLLGGTLLAYLKTTEATTGPKGTTEAPWVETNRCKEIAFRINLPPRINKLSPWNRWTFGNRIEKKNVPKIKSCY